MSELEYAIREERAASYDSEYAFVHGSWFPRLELAVVLRLLDLRGDEVLLDYGCGTGRLTVDLARQCKRVIAVDRSPASLEILRKRIRDSGIHNVTIVQSDLTEQLDLSERPTKAVSVQLLQHIPRQEARRATIRNLGRVLQPKASAIFVEEANGVVRHLRARPREIAEPNRLFFHPFTPTEFKAEIEAGGFELSRIGGCGVLYWTRYRALARSLVELDRLLAYMPGAGWFAKFVTAAAVWR